jgi:ElaB/YqjD/DUF883 family membrane-anchored ribosome-binding protein
MSTRDFQQQSERAKHEAEQAKQRAEKAAQEGKEAAKGMAENAKATVEEGANKLATTLHDVADTAESKGREMVHGVRDQIEAKPVTSTLTALGIGVFIGWLLAGRRH